MARRSPMVAKAYDENFAMWQKKEEEKHFAREREKSERIRHYRETTAAPIPPQTTYRKNQREWAVYRYQVKRYEKGKPYQNISYPHIWCYTHRIALSVTSVILAAVITVTCVFALRDTRFRAENLIKIGLGADEKRVTEVLGEPFQKETNGWYYYSKNYASIMEKMEELEEKSKNVSSYEEFEKLAEKSEKLQKELEGLEYQIIFIAYSADGTVEQMILDTKASDTMPPDKTITEVTISPTSYTVGSNTRVSYSIACDDGSYRMAYFSQSQLPTSKGEQTIEWYDAWGQCSAKIFCTLMLYCRSICICCRNGSAALLRRSAPRAAQGRHTVGLAKGAARNPPPVSLRSPPVAVAGTAATPSARPLHSSKRGRSNPFALRALPLRGAARHPLPPPTAELPLHWEPRGGR